MRQSSQQPFARSQTRSSSERSMPGHRLLARGPGPARLEGPARPRLEDPEQAPGLAVAIYLPHLGRGELPGLGLFSQLAHAGSVLVAEVQAKDVAGQVRRQGLPAILQEAAEDRELA